ncbi:hypothetical protein J437_LFUL012621 [Ladona fulva]|uniref:Reverse transcriptase domain-containing protein n=1 Tax=Ladona fulva TaxID=123851 RepID=A0A8K0KD21_LADFU|nr:hypothetical protein J437_LFUL012621 [Ladona fulva]
MMGYRAIIVTVLKTPKPVKQRLTIADLAPTMEALRSTSTREVVRRMIVSTGQAFLKVDRIWCSKEVGKISGSCLDDTKAKIKLDNKISETFRVGNENITHLAYVDDIVSLSHTAEELKMIMQALESTAIKFGLRVSPTKTKCMIVGRRQQPEVQEIRDYYTGEWRRLYNAELNERYKEPNIIGVMKSRRLEWAGRVVRMSRERWPKIAMDMIPAGKRPAGRPRKRWIDGVKEDLQLFEYNYSILFSIDCPISTKM